MTPIVLVPGLLCSAEVFAPQVAALWPFGPVTIASTLDCKTVPEMAAAVLATAPPRFALAGISMGGYICFEIMRQAPERVIKLALLDTSARSDTPEQITQRRALVAQTRTGDFEARLSQASSAILHPKHQKVSALREVNVRMAVTVGVDGFERQVEAVIPRIDSRPSLPAISIPTRVLVGDRDPLTPPDQAEEMAAAIPDTRLVVAPECGHASTLEQPEAVTRALIEWITGCVEDVQRIGVNANGPDRSNAAPTWRTRRTWRLNRMMPFLSLAERPLSPLVARRLSFRPRPGPEIQTGSRPGRRLYPPFSRSAERIAKAAISAAVAKSTPKIHQRPESPAPARRLSTVTELAQMIPQVSAPASTAAAIVNSSLRR